MEKEDLYNDVKDFIKQKKAEGVEIVSEGSKAGWNVFKNQFVSKIEDGYVARGADVSNPEGDNFGDDWGWSALHIKDSTETPEEFHYVAVWVKGTGFFYPKDRNTMNELYALLTGAAAASPLQPSVTAIPPKQAKPKPKPKPKPTPKPTPAAQPQSRAQQRGLHKV